MDLRIDIDGANMAVDAYGKAAMQLAESIGRMKARHESIAFREWSGQGKDTFDECVSLWFAQAASVLADIRGTGDALALYAIGEADGLRQSCEQFEASFD